MLTGQQKRTIYLNVLIKTVVATLHIDFLKVLIPIFAHLDRQVK